MCIMTWRATLGKKGSDILAADMEGHPRLPRTAANMAVPFEETIVFCFLRSFSKNSFGLPKTIFPLLRLFVRADPEGSTRTAQARPSAACCAANAPKTSEILCNPLKPPETS